MSFFNTHHGSYRVASTFTDGDGDAVKIDVFRGFAAAEDGAYGLVISAGSAAVGLHHADLLELKRLVDLALEG